MQRAGQLPAVGSPAFPSKNLTASDVPTVSTSAWLTNYPQLGGRGLHIAHLLWGYWPAWAAVRAMAML